MLSIDLVWKIHVFWSSSFVLLKSRSFFIDTSWFSCFACIYRGFFFISSDEPGFLLTDKSVPVVESYSKLFYTPCPRKNKPTFIFMIALANINWFFICYCCIYRWTAEQDGINPTSLPENCFCTNLWNLKCLTLQLFIIAEIIFTASDVNLRFMISWRVFPLGSFIFIIPVLTYMLNADVIQHYSDKFMTVSAKCLGRFGTALCMLWGAAQLTAYVHDWRGDEFWKHTVN